MALPRTLGCLWTVPPEEAARRGLFIEIPPRLDARITPAHAALGLTGHAPFDFSDGPGTWPRKGRLNIAALDPDWRRQSLDCLEAYLQRAASLPKLRKVVMHAAPRFWKDETPEKLPAEERARGAPASPQPAGEYALLIESFRRLAEIAHKLKLEIVIENNRAYWDAIPDDRPFLKADRSAVREYFATTPWEWLQVWRDVARDNVGLCLDTSHAVTWAQRLENPGERGPALRAFLDEPGALRHIHWNGNDLLAVTGRNDRHLPLHTSSLGDEFNRAVRGLTGVSHLLEHFTDLETLDRELRYIAEL